MGPRGVLPIISCHETEDRSSQRWCYTDVHNTSVSKYLTIKRSLGDIEKPETGHTATIVYRCTVHRARGAGRLMPLNARRCELGGLEPGSSLGPGPRCFSWHSSMHGLPHTQQAERGEVQPARFFYHGSCVLVGAGRQNIDSHTQICLLPPAHTREGSPGA